MGPTTVLGSGSWSAVASGISMVWGSPEAGTARHSEPDWAGLVPMFAQPARAAAAAAHTASAQARAAVNRIERMVQLS